MQGAERGFHRLIIRRAGDDAGRSALAEFPQTGGLLLCVGGLGLAQVERDVEAREILPHALDAAPQRGGSCCVRQQNADGQLLFLVIERLCERVGLVAVLFEQGADLLALRLAHARTVVNDLVDRGFMYARHIGDLSVTDIIVPPLLRDRFSFSIIALFRGLRKRKFEKHQKSTAHRRAVCGRCGNYERR